MSHFMNQQGSQLNLLLTLWEAALLSKARGRQWRIIVRIWSPSASPVTPRDLSPSPPLCLYDNLSSLASRWPFVCDDLLIFVRPPLAGLLTLVVLSSSLPGDSAKWTFCHQRGDNNSKSTTSEWRRHWQIPVLKTVLVLESRFFSTDLK